LKTELTIKMENAIYNTTRKIGTFGCFEVTIGFGGKERVDYITYDTKGVFRCYEIKVSKSDFHSAAIKSFVGNYNYYVMPKELYEEVKDEISKEIGVYIGENCIKKAKKQELKIDSETLKDSIIRSLYRDSEKLMKLENKQYLDKLKNELEKQRKYLCEENLKYSNLLNFVRENYGRDAVKKFYETNNL